MAIRLVVDSSSDLPKDYIHNYNIVVVPLHVVFGNDEYRDGEDITPSEFYSKLIEADEMPTTSQVTPDRFVIEFKQIINKGDEVLCITIGSNASGTCQAAFLAQKEFNSDMISVIDSNCLSMGIGYIIMLANEMIQLNLGRDEIVSRIKPYTKNRIEHLFCVDTIEYLKKGGRIRASKAFVAEILNIKPILNVKDAITQPIGKVRGRKKIIPYYLTHIENSMDFEASKYLLVAHGDDLEFAKEFVEAFKEQFNWEKPVIVSEIGATIGTHAGPGVLALFYIKR